MCAHSWENWMCLEQPARKKTLAMPFWIEGSELDTSRGCPLPLRSQGNFFSGNGCIYWTRKLLQNVPCFLPKHSLLFITLTVIFREKQCFNSPAYAASVQCPHEIPPKYLNRILATHYLMGVFWGFCFYVRKLLLNASLLLFWVTLPLGSDFARNSRYVQ